LVLGIDLGTSNTVAASLSRDGNPVLIPDVHNRDQQTTPSLALIDGKKAYAGQFAENLFEVFPQKRLISFFKRHFGTGEPVYFDDYNSPWFSESIAALLLKKIKHDAEIFLPDGFENLVITVPAHYNDVQRKSVIEAARLADMELSGIIEEPIAAALFYGSFNKKIDDEIILVYDFGGGTFDLTLITKSANEVHVIAKDGVNKLGGKEFDDIISNHITDSYLKAFGGSFPNEKLVQNRLQKIAEQVKIEINQLEDRKNVKRWMLFGRDAFECTFEYDMYADRAHQLIAKTEAAVQRCLRSLGMTLADVNKIIMIGGTSTSKFVYNYWKTKLTDKQELIAHQPLSSVAKGAALYAASLKGSNGGSDVRPINLKSVSTYNIGLLPENAAAGRIDLLIHRNTPLPVSSKKTYKINPQTNPKFTIELCQFWDAEEELHKLGTIVVGPIQSFSEMYLDVIVENKLNGTIAVKVKNADNQKDIKFEFIKKQSKHKYDYQTQKNLVESVYLNHNF
jgi:molecular chaperone DnaK (HSP70)